MALPIPPINPNNPIPNNPFYFPETDALSTVSGPLIVGSGINIDYATGTISATGGGGAGNVQVVAPITNTGTASDPVIGIQAATVGQLGAVKIGTNIQVLAGAISVRDASTAQRGVVQLNDTTTSTSISEALTAAQGKFLQDQINDIAFSSNLILAGTFDAVASQLVTVTTDGSAAGFNIGSNLPAASPSNANYFVIVVVGGTYTPPGGTAVTCKSGDWFLSSGTEWTYLAVGPEYPGASTTTPGIVRLATATEAEAGVDDSIALTPFSAAGFIRAASYTSKGSLITASDPGVTTLLEAGGDGCFLVANSASTSGLSWQSNNAIPCSCVTGRGSLITGTDPSVVTSLPLGGVGQVLTVSSIPGGCGLTWCTPVSGSVTSITAGPGLSGGTITTTGTISLPVQAGVIANTYGYPSSVTVDSFGRITAVSAGPQPVPLSLLSSQGQLITAVNGGLATALSLGADGQVLTVDRSTPAGLKWSAAGASGTVTSISAGNGICIPGGPITTVGTICLAPISPALITGAYTTPQLTVDAYGRITAITEGTSKIPVTCITEKGALITGIGANNPTALSLGGQGQVLTVDSSSATGLSWSTPSSGGIPCGFLVNKGWLVVGCAPSTPIGLQPGGIGQILTVDSSTDSGLKWAQNTAIPCSCLIAKGALITAEQAGCPNALLPGSNGQILTVDTSNTRGLKWAANTAIPCSTLTAKGAIITACCAGTPIALGLGSNNQVLAVDTSTTTGLKWVDDPAGIPCSCLPSQGYLVVGSSSAPNTPYSLQPGGNGTILTVDGASPGGLKWAVNNSVPVTCWAQKGQMVVGFGNCTIGPLPLGGNGTILTADPGLAPGMKWATNTAIPYTYLTGKGSLVTAICANCPATLTAGCNGEILVACSASTTGLCWLPPTVVSTAIPCACITAKGTLIVGCAANTPIALSVGSTNGQILVVDGISPAGMKWVPNTAIPCTCLTSRGALITTTGSLNCPVTLTVGGEGQFLKVCSASTNGLCWADLPASTAIPCACITAKGTLIVGCAANTPIALTAGSNGQVLTVDTSTASGLKWAPGGATAATPQIRGTVFGYTASSASSAAVNLTLGYLAGGVDPSFTPVCGCYNTAIGDRSQCCYLTPSCYNTSVGSLAFQIVNGNSNTAIGSGALELSTCSIANVAVGAGALADVCCSIQNTAIGGGSMRGTGLNINGGVFNTAVGYNSFRSQMSANTSFGSCNVSVGAFAAGGCGSRNVHIGLSAGGVSQGSDMVAIGNSVLMCSNFTDSITAIGSYAACYLLCGANNVFLGCKAGSNLQCGSFNVYIGSNAQAANFVANNEVAIWNGCVRASYSGNTGCWSFVSDARDKTDIEPLALGLNFIEQVQPRKFKWNHRHDKNPTNTESSGFIAQELLEVVNQFDASYSGLVSTCNPDQYAVAATGLIPILVNAVKELSAESTALRVEVTSLRCEINALKGG